MIRDGTTAIELQNRCTATVLIRLFRGAPPAVRESPFAAPQSPTSRRPAAFRRRRAGVRRARPLRRWALSRFLCDRPTSEKKAAYRQTPASYMSMVISGPMTMPVANPAPQDTRPERFLSYRQANPPKLTKAITPNPVSQILLIRRCSPREKRDGPGWSENHPSQHGRRRPKGTLRP